MNIDVHDKTLRVSIDGQEYEFDDPKPLGRQLLDKAGKRPVEEFVIYLFLDNGLMEGINQDETVNLRKPGIERFITFNTDRIFRFQLDGRNFEWGANLITGLTLKNLAGVDPVRHEVWLENRGHGDDRLIADRETVDLSEEGLERFFTIDGHSKEIEVFVNEKPVVLIGKEHTGLEIKQAAIDQGVKIQLDFVLSVEISPGKTKIIGDNEEIKVHRHQKFIAIADDDNS